MSLVEQLEYEGMVKLDDLNNEVQNKNQEMLALIAQMKDRGMNREEKNRLNESFKKLLVSLIKLKQKK